MPFSWARTQVLWKSQSQQAVVGYSLAYPMGVLGVIIGLVLLKRVLKINFGAEAKELARDYPLGDKLVNRTFRVEHEDLAGKDPAGVYPGP
jgi:putative transport protein